VSTHASGQHSGNNRQQQAAHATPKTEAARVLRTQGLFFLPPPALNREKRPAAIDRFGRAQGLARIRHANAVHLVRSADAPDRLAACA
jgi:hypothetical protein